MSQRKPETIIISVPQDWTDKDKDELKALLVRTTAHSKWENCLFLITNKMEVKVVDADTMDALKKLQQEAEDSLKKEGKNVHGSSGRKDTGRTDEFSDESPSKDFEDYKEKYPDWKKKTKRTSGQK